MTMVTLDDVEEARTAMLQKRPREGGGLLEPILHTPCVRAPWLEELAMKSWGTSARDGLEVRLKLETWQETASFKQRGAFNKLRCLRRDNPDARIRVYTASAGNHAQGVARHAKDFCIRATIIMPTGTPGVKVENTRRLLGDQEGVVLHGADYDVAKKEAERLLNHDRAENPADVVEMVHAFDDPAVIAGQGTLGLEILEDWPEAEVVVAGVGGGGLISGIAVALKERAARGGGAAAAVIGVESAAEPAAYLDRKHGGRDEPLDIKVRGMKLGTIADGISVAAVGEHTMRFLRDAAYVDELLTVQESEIASAIALMLRMGKMQIEGACATTVAALLNAANREHFRGKKVVLVLSGGNLDPARLAQIIHWRELADHVERTGQHPDDAWDRAMQPPAA